MTSTASVTGLLQTQKLLRLRVRITRRRFRYRKSVLRTNGVQTFSITVRDSDGDLIRGALTVTVSGPGISLEVYPPLMAPVR